MINGLKFELSANELIEQCKMRKSHHIHKAFLYKEQLKLMVGIVVPTSVSNMPDRDLKSRIETHEAKAKFFEFLENHISLNEVFLLTSRELEEMEFIAVHYIQQEKQNEKSSKNQRRKYHTNNLTGAIRALVIIQMKKEIKSVRSVSQYQKLLLNVANNEEFWTKVSTLVSAAKSLDMLETIY